MIILFYFILYNQYCVIFIYIYSMTKSFSNNQIYYIPVVFKLSEDSLKSVDNFTNNLQNILNSSYYDLLDIWFKDNTSYIENHTYNLFIRFDDFDCEIDVVPLLYCRKHTLDSNSIETLKLYYPLFCREKYFICWISVID